MIDRIPIKKSQAVFGRGEFTYKKVINSFKDAKFIGIMTFNISPKTDSFLLNSLKHACANGANATIITNIPKRFPSYFGEQYAVDAKKMIDVYIAQLDPKEYSMRLNPYFTFYNHAKIVMTDRIVYWGSSNFSDESMGNYECGTISTDRNLIKYLKNTVFMSIKNKSVPFYKYNFAVAIANLDELISICKAAKQQLFEASFEPVSEYETNFEEKWIYCRHDSGITVDFLREFLHQFNRFEDSLNVIDSIIDEYYELDELPEQVECLKDLFDEYKKTFSEFYETISSLFYKLENVAQYDVSYEACKIINNEYGMEAYDENLDYYSEIAMREATSEYEEIICNSETTINEALESLDMMITYFEKIKSNLFQLLIIDPRINNTGIR